MSYPNTYKAISTEGREQVFDPALKQFVSALRPGGPVFYDPDTEREWLDTGRGVVDHLLRMVDGSEWDAHLVLRGSLLLKAWFGDAAREPGDIDWVFQPKDVGVHDPQADELFENLKRIFTEHPHIGNAQILVDKIAVDDIWTYERADGRRIVVPWEAQGLPPGHLQIDIVFSEELFSEPIPVEIPSRDGGSVSVWAADEPLSLAWKLLWLETDFYPQGKDLYDATLLAERTWLPQDLLEKVMRYQRQRSGEGPLASDLASDFPMRWRVDWENFKREYPGIEGEAEHWQERLTRALAPLFRARSKRDMDL